MVEDRNYFQSPLFYEAGLTGIFYCRIPAYPVSTRRIKAAIGTRAVRNKKWA